MGVSTDFFVASEEELRRCFPDWHLVTGRRIPRQLPNPFKPGETRLVWDWERGNPAVEGIAAIYPYPIKQLPHVLLKNIDPVKLAQLQQLLNGGEFQEALDAMCVPALIPPGKSEASLMRLPENFIRALADTENVHDLAQRWSQTEEMLADNWPIDVVRETILGLKDVASLALSQRKGLFLLMGC
jgi:hypothetical protein